MLISHVKAGGTYSYHWSLKGQHKCGKRSEMPGTQAIFAGVFPGLPNGKLHDSTQSSHDRFLRNPFQYIIHPTIRPCTALATYALHIRLTYRNVLITG